MNFHQVNQNGPEMNRLSEDVGTKTLEWHSQSIGTSPSDSEPLTDKYESEVLSFLANRPMHTVMLAGFIRDNGLASPLNRGTFYGYRDSAGRLKGVALIGEITTFEARTDLALAAFARCAQKAPKSGVIIGEQKKVSKFWHYYSEDGRTPPVLCRELLYELRVANAVYDPAPDLRTATVEDLDPVMATHAQMAYEESGINPLEVDPHGFRSRCARRIKQGRVWVLIEDHKLIFKADVISQTPEVTYLEGIFVAPEKRGEGSGFRCLSQVAGTLLGRTKSVCLLVNQNNREAQRLYRKCNFQLRDHYDTIFLPPTQ